MANRAVQTTVTPLSTSDIASLLGESGDLSSGSSFHRISLKQGMLETDDGLMFPSRQMKEPALTVRIVSPPVYYNAWWLGKDPNSGNFDITTIPGFEGRTDLLGRFAKKYDNPADQQNDRFANTDLYEAIERATGQRGTFKADMQVQILPEDGQFKGDETTYLLTLNTTSALDFRGSSKNRTGGTAQDKNFIIQLAEFAVARAAEAGGDEFAQRQEVMKAMEALKTGNVVADVYLPLMKRDNFNWTAIAFVPRFYQTDDEAPALEAGDPLATDSDDLPV